MRSLKFISAFLFIFFVGMSVNNISVSSSGLLLQSASAEAAQAATTQTTKKPPSASLAKTKAWGKAQTNKLKLKAMTFTEEKAGGPLDNLFNTLSQWARKFMVPISYLVGLFFIYTGGMALKRLADEGKRTEVKEVYGRFIVGTCIIAIVKVIAIILPEANGCNVDTFISGVCGATPMTTGGDLLQSINKANTGYMAVFGQFFKVADAVSAFIVAVGAWCLFFAICSFINVSKENGQSTFGGSVLRTIASALLIDHRHMWDMTFSFLQSIGFMS